MKVGKFYCPSCGCVHDIDVVEVSQETTYCGLYICEWNCICHRCGTKFDVKQEVDSDNLNLLKSNYFDYVEDLKRECQELKKELIKKETRIENFKEVVAENNKRINELKVINKRNKEVLIKLQDRLIQYSDTIRREGESLREDIPKLAEEYGGETNE